MMEEMMNDKERLDDGTTAGIDEDRTEGSIKQTGGKMKEGAAKLFGDNKMKDEGRAEQAEGKLQNARGSVKDEARDMAGGDDKDDCR
jgi:uncharacterized protein YjbJ (UPF0337 family)